MSTGLASFGTPATAAKINANIVTCYLCGRDFTIHSLPIHEPKCLERWTLEEAKKPPSQRRPPPTRPVVPGMRLAPHPSSSRESSPTRSAKPRKSLSGSDLPQVVVSFPTDPALLLQYNAKVRENYLEHVRLECEWCGRKFADEERLAVHNRSCTQENPAKRRGSATLTGAVPPSGRLSPSQSGGCLSPAMAALSTPLRKSQSAMHLSSPPSATSSAGPPQAGAGTVKPRRSFMLFGRKSQSAAADEAPAKPEKEKEKEKEAEHLAIPARTVSARPRRSSAAPALSVTTASPSSSASNALPVPPKSPRTSVSSSRRSSPLAVTTSASHRRASSSSAVSTSSSSAAGGPVVSVSATVNAGSAGGKARFCVQCGKKYADADRFCAHCGNRR
ncbi:hypothetical protein GGF32_004353 [Allomyces javanicus]|nr:hypothetical protein GGF32_004353 [Allomyces javanicus]